MNTILDLNKNLDLNNSHLVDNALRDTNTLHSYTTQSSTQSPTQSPTSQDTTPLSPTHKYTAGVFLARFQPLHNAHLYVIETALKECDILVIMVGSSNKKNMLRNPFSSELRKNMIKASLKDSKDFDRVKIFELPDWSQESIREDDKVWGSYFYYNAVACAQQKNLTLYYNDDPNIISSWFNDDIRKNVQLRFLERQSVYDGLSATKIRQALLDYSDNDKLYLQKCLPKPVYDEVELLRNTWLQVYKNPQPDFTAK